MLFRELISEGYINAVGFDERAQSIKEKYKDEVWDLLQQSYAGIGGIKGSGFGSPDEMVTQIPFWKIATRAGNPVAVILYKDKGGRKLVAAGSDGSEDAKFFINDIFKNEIHRSYGENSKAALGKMMKVIPWPVLTYYLKTPDQVQKLLPNDEIIPIADVPRDQWPEDAQVTLLRYPQLASYGYLRELGGDLTFKVLIGTLDKKISG